LCKGLYFDSRLCTDKAKVIVNNMKNSGGDWVVVEDRRTSLEKHTNKGPLTTSINRNKNTNSTTNRRNKNNK